MHKNVRSSLIHNNSKLERKQMPFNRRMDKHTGTFIKWTTTQQYQWISHPYGRHQHRQQHGGISKILCWVKQVTDQKTKETYPVVQFFKFKNRQPSSWVAGNDREGAWRIFLASGNVSHLDWVDGYTDVCTYQTSLNSTPKILCTSLCVTLVSIENKRIHWKHRL